ncbi:MAG: efflux RND transporter periplasmic adaptor subunit [Bacteroidota bacterium]
MGTFIPVRVTEVVDQQVPELLKYSGNIVPYKVIKFGFMVAGKIKEVPVVEGQYVNEGDLIAVMEPADYDFALDAARAQYEEAGKEYDRLKAMYNKGSLTQSDFDKITALKQEATANYDYKRKQVHDTRLYSPANGWLVVEGIEPGEIIPQGYPVFAIIQTRQVFVEASIPENEINRIKLGQRVNVRIPALPDTLFEGTVSRLSQVADPYSRSYPVKATLNNPGHLLKAGMIAFVEIPTGKTTAIIRIPANAIVTDATGHTFTYVVKEDHVTKRPVQTGRAAGNQVEILAGLTADEFVVTEGVTKLYEGAMIAIKP